MGLRSSPALACAASSLFLRHDENSVVVLVTLATYSLVCDPPSKSSR